MGAAFFVLLPPARVPVYGAPAREAWCTLRRSVRRAARSSGTVRQLVAADQLRLPEPARPQRRFSCMAS
jgi:hypothetical protein